MAVRVGINGFGRIGRLVFRVMAAQPEDFEVVAINDLSDAKHLALLLKYDSVHGRFKGTVEAGEESLIVNGKEIKITQEKDPANLPWKALKCQVALESTGFFTNKAGAPEAHRRRRRAGDPLAPRPRTSSTRRSSWASTTRRSSPSTGSSPTPRCTTNCLAPMAKVLHETFGIEKGLMTTCHAYTNDQRVADQVHTDPYRARAAAINIIPSTTGAAKAVGEVIPELNGKLTGYALRVPVPDGSITDLTSLLKQRRDQGRGQRRHQGRRRRAAQGHHRVRDRPARLQRHHRQPALVHLHGRLDQRHRRQPGQDDLLVRQRVGLLLPDRRADHQGRQAGLSRDRSADRPTMPDPATRRRPIRASAVARSHDLRGPSPCPSRRSATWT